MGAAIRRRSACRTKGLEALLHLLLHIRDGVIQCIDLIEMQPEHEAVVWGHAAVQRLAQFPFGSLRDFMTGDEL